MTQLRKAVEEVTRPLKCGCRIVEDLDGTLFVYDLGKWTQEQTELLLFLCPEARMSVQASPQSLSGFTLVFRRHMPSRLSLRIWLVVLGCFLCLPLSSCLLLLFEAQKRT